MNYILIIEDEKQVQEIVKAYLEKEGYKVACADNGLDGLEKFQKGSFQLIILDLMLPDISGEEICKKVREASEVHIFMVTAKSTLDNKVEGLNLGADEYLVKPLSPRELTARVNALFRRIKKEDTQNLLSFNNGKIVIDNDKRIVKKNGEEIYLTANEFDLLYVLAANSGNVLSREQLIKKVFGYDFDGFDRTIDVHIKNIRKKLEDDSKNPKYIITVIKSGYKFLEKEK